jgi:AIPR protein
MRGRSTSAKAAAAVAFRFPYITCRNISAPEDDEANRKIYSGHAKASSVLDLEDNENVREYLVDAQGKQKQTPTLVHQAIRKTLNDNPDQFSVLNGGMVIVARGAEIDDKNKVLILKKPQHYKRLPDPRGTAPLFCAAPERRRVRSQH